MDISDLDTDDDYVAVDATDDEWVASGKLRVNRKRNSRSRRSSSENSQSSNDASNVEDDSSKPVGASGEANMCCTCSKSSYCKTSKCQCKSLGNTCGSSCGCLETKCANRGFILNSEETDKDLATQGAELLQSALTKNSNTDNGSRKPLADIGNTVLGKTF